MDYEARKKIVAAELLEAERALESANQKKREIDEEIMIAQDKLKDLKPLKERAIGEYKDKIYEVSEKEVKLVEMDRAIDVIKRGEKRMLARLEAEIKDKTHALNKFKATKKDFIKSLDKREAALNEKEDELVTMAQDIDNERDSLEHREAELKNGLEALTKNMGAIKHQEIQIKATQGQTDAKYRNTELSLTKALKLKAGIEAEMDKQQEITKILTNRGKIVDAREESLNKREQFLNKEELQIKKDRAKLEDDRRSLNRAWAARHSNHGQRIFSQGR